MNIEHRPATEEDLPSILNLQLCEADVAEIKALTGSDPQQTLRDSVKVTPEPWVVYMDGQLVAVYGVAPVPEQTFGMPWFLSTGDMKLFTREFLKGSKAALQRLHSEYEALSNVVDSRHTAALRWLIWLGFEFLPTTHTYHDPDVTFYQFVRYQRHV